MSNLIRIKVIVFKSNGKYYTTDYADVNKYKSPYDAFKEAVEYLNTQYKDKYYVTTDEFFGCPFMSVIE